MTPLLTTRDAANLLRVHRRTVERLIAAGRLRAVRVGGRWRLDEGHLSADLGLVRPDAERRRRALADREHSAATARLCGGSKA